MNEPKKLKLTVSSLVGRKLTEAELAEISGGRIFLRNSTGCPTTTNTGSCCTDPNDTACQ